MLEHEMENRKMDNEKTCAALICESRWYLPSLNKFVGLAENVQVTDWPTDAEFIKNTAYRECDLPGEVWGEDISSRVKNQAGWLCAYHAHGDESVFIKATVADLWDVGAYMRELNARQADRPVRSSIALEENRTLENPDDELP
jgi:hypothetical protein